MIVKERKRNPRRSEKTGPQTVSYSYGDGILQKTIPAIGTYAQLRVIRKDPTIALARGVLISCIQAGSWNIEADEGVCDGVIDFLNHILKLREDFIYNCVAYGRVDFGWIGFEKIFKIKDDRIVIDALKPLLHDMTWILVTKKGRFNGYRQRGIGYGQMGDTTSGAMPVFPLDLFTQKCMHIAFGIEAGNLYGYPLLENVRATLTMWDEANDGARRYDKKVAGSHWAVYYPPGTGFVDGEVTDNGEIAALLLEALESSGSVSLPTTAAELMQEIPNVAVAEIYAWRVELIDDKGRKQEAFGKRLKYLDVQKVRGLLLPERSLLEGEFGTKAEAGEHIGLMITNMQEIDRHITRMVNEQLVNQLLRLNYGDELVDKVRLTSTPLVDKQIGFIRDIYKGLNDPNIDLQGLRDKLDIPTLIGGSKTEVVEPDDEDEDDPNSSDEKDKDKIKD